MTTAEYKRELRRKLRASYAATPRSSIIARSRELTNRLLEHPWCRAANSLFCYLDHFHWEPETRPLITTLIEMGKVVAVPRLTDGCMSAVIVPSLTGVHRGALGIDEPNHTEILNEPDLIIVPGLAFSADGWRLGLGGGNYDRYLATHHGKTIAAIFDFQLQELIPRDPHDRQVETLIIA